MNDNGMLNALKAVEYFRNGYNCAQSVLAAYGPRLGLDEDTCLKVACSFGAGMGRMQHDCGAVTGAFMALGLRYGKGSGDGEEKKSRTYDFVREFARRFEEMHGSINCLALLECDITTESGHLRAKELGLFQSRCEAYVRDASRILDGMLGLRET
jgi:C_GCAxxG_C_C family probable redox protein